MASDPTQPFPYWGGKRRIAGEVWRRFGSVTNYVEPFLGGGGVLLARPGGPGRVETVNDTDCLLTNFWRAVKLHPAQLADACRYPPSELDLLARQRWLAGRREEIRQRFVDDAEYCDVGAAAWWVYGACNHIGPEWHSGAGARPGPPHLGNGGKGVVTRLPYLLDPRCAYRPGADIHRDLAVLSGRLMRTRICCGDWGRVLSPAVTWRHGLTGVFLDPPYTFVAGRRPGLYFDDDPTVGFDVRDWAVENGGNPELRIALCGLEGEHDMPPDWRVFTWRSSRGKDVEAVWFSPSCLA